MTMPKTALCRGSGETRAVQAFDDLSQAFRGYRETFPEDAFPTFLEALLFESIPPVPGEARPGRRRGAVRSRRTRSEFAV